MTTNIANASYKATNIGGSGGPSGTSSRTLGDRVGDFVNVKDFGATGNGSSDDTAAIQSAIDWTVGNNRGTIYFPPGTYIVTSSLTLNTDPISVILRGEGNLSIIQGNFADYIIKRSVTNATSGVRIIEKLSIKNQDTTAGGGIQLLGSVNATIRDCIIQAFTGVDITTGSETTMINCTLSCSATGSPATSIGIMLGGNSALYSCDVSGFGDGVRASGSGVAIIGGRFEVNRKGLNIGVDSGGGTLQMQGGLIGGLSMEANDVAIYVNAASNSSFYGIHIIGSANSPSSGSVYGIQIPDTSANHVVFGGLSLSGGFSQYAFLLGANLTGVSFFGCIGANNGVGIWSISQSSGAQFLGSNISAPGTQTFANRPFQTGGNPSEGDMWTFTDSNTATFGATIAGSGANRVVGRYSANGSVWTVAAIAT